MDLLRGLFGIPRRDGRSSGGQQYHLRTDEEDDDESGVESRVPIRASPPGQVPPFSVFTDPQDMHRFFDQQMDDVLKIFQSFFGAAFDGMPGSGIGKALPDHSGEEEEDLGTRDYMLMDQRPGYLPPVHKFSPSPNDQILETLTPEQLDQFYQDQSKDPGASQPSGHGVQRHPFFGFSPFGMNPQIEEGGEGGRSRVFSFGQSFSKSTIVMPDGTVEERCTVRNSDGQTRTTVTRRSADGRSLTTDSLDPSQPEEDNPSRRTMLKVQQDKNSFFDNLFKF